MSESIFTTDDSRIVQGEPKVVVEDFLIWSVNGQVVGRLDATFDFSDLDPALHAAAVNMLGQSRKHVCMGPGAAAVYWPTQYSPPTPEPPPEAPQGFWRGLLGWLGF